MSKHHYVYHSYEKWGREYIGIRSCDCLPEEDIKYFGSFKDKTFNPTEKTILFVRETREEVAEIEIILHDFFDVAINPQFANQAKAISTKFDTTGVPCTEEHRRKNSVAKSGEKNPQFGVPRTEETKKKISKALSGEKNPMHGRTGEKHPNYGNTGALSPRSKAIIAIKPDGTELHFGSGHEAARKLEINQSSLCQYLKTGKSPTRGKFKEWRFIYENPEVFH
jgi:group I intron endonuclease